MCAVKGKPGVMISSMEDTVMPDILKVQMLMDQVQVFFAKWLQNHLSKVYPNGLWEAGVLGALSPEQRDNALEDGAKEIEDLDFASLVAVFLGNFRLLRREAHIDAELSDLAKHVKKIRNLCAHKNARMIANGDKRKMQYHVDTLHQFLLGLGADGSLLSDVESLSQPELKTLQTKPGGLSTAQKGIVMKVSPLDIGKKNVSVRIEEAMPIQVARPVTLDERSESDSSMHQASSSCSQAAVSHCKDNVNFARTMWEDVFSSDAIILDGAKRALSPVRGKGLWDYLVVLPFIGSPDKALKAASDMWHCPDTDPYVQGSHIVWEFPQFRESCAAEEESVANIYPAGYFPLRFDSYILAQPGTDYKPDLGRVSNNLNSKTPDAFWYLGNYFPRSFVESFCIYDYIFSFGFDAVRGKKSELTICDVGIGSGGATYGLIWALRKRLFGDGTFKKIRVIGFDGNQNALNIFTDLKNVIECEWPIDFEYVTEQVRFSSASIIPMDKVASKADFVITSKCLQELGHTRQDIQALYERYFSEAQAIVSDDGLISVLEIDNLNRSTALEKALRTLSGGRVVVAPRCDECGCVGFERIDLYSTRIKSVVGENVLFTVVGPSSFAERFPRWVPAARPALNTQDIDSESEESSRERE